MASCPKSQYKDDRHDWHGQAVVDKVSRDLSLRYCPMCGRVEVLHLTDSGSQAGNVWEVIAAGQKGVVLHG